MIGVYVNQRQKRRQPFIASCVAGTWTLGNPTRFAMTPDKRLDLAAFPGAMKDCKRRRCRHGSGQSHAGYALNREAALNTIRRGIYET